MKKSTKMYNQLSSIVEHTLTELIDSVIIKVGNHYVLYNKYTIKRELDHVVVFKRDNYESYEFNYMKNAMIWVLLDRNQKFLERNRIYRLDKELTSIEIDKKIHTKLKLKYIQDIDRYSIYATKLQKDIAKQKQIVIEIDKYFILANRYSNKYHKQETKNEINRTSPIKKKSNSTSTS